MNKTILRNALIINESKRFYCDVLISGERIEKIDQNINIRSSFKEFNLNGNYLFPGMIDDQVHFREPGLTYKGDIYSESRAAVAGGITSFMEMPNTVPNTLTQKLLEDKYYIASKSSAANYSFYMGASNDNIEEVLLTNKEKVCGIKVFMGSSTGNMLVDNYNTLEKIFSTVDSLIATHCEDESTIQQNLRLFHEKYGDNISPEMHPLIRSTDACYLSSSKAVALAKKHGSRLHVLHISSAKEISLFKSNEPLNKKRITAEACIHHLYFNESAYKTKGNFIKWNPAVKSETDRLSIIKAVNEGTIDVIATDHAPHTLEEKKRGYLNCPSGGPLVQHALLALLDLSLAGEIDLELIAQKTAHNPAILFNIKDRGFIREGFYADLVVINPNKPHLVSKENLLYKCQWSPFLNKSFKCSIDKTFVNGCLVWDGHQINNNNNGMRLEFSRN